MAQVTYIGTEDDHSTQTITEGGVTFVKGQPEAVDEKHAHLGVKWLPKFRENPTFVVDDKVELPDDEDERQGIIGELEQRGIKYRANASTASLRKALADHVETGEA